MTLFCSILVKDQQRIDKICFFLFTGKAKRLQRGLPIPITKDRFWICVTLQAKDWYLKAYKWTFNSGCTVKTEEKASRFSAPVIQWFPTQDLELENHLQKPAAENLKHVLIQNKKPVKDNPQHSGCWALGEACSVSFSCHLRQAIHPCRPQKLLFAQP